MSYLEVQVAMILLAISTTGLYSISVIQTRQSARLTESAFGEYADEQAAINPSTNPWARKLGVLATIEDGIAPSIAIEPQQSFTAIKDGHQSPSPNTHQGSGDFWSWNSWSFYRSYNGQAHYHYQPSSSGEGSYFEQEITGIPHGNYEILVTYPWLGSLGQSISHQIYDGPTLIRTVFVNQRTANSDTRLNNHTWDRLDVLPITSGTLRIRILDGPTGSSYVVADAIAVRTRRFELTSVGPTNSGGATAVLEVP